RMVDQLSSFADEVTRVAREVGTEGKLGGQAEVADVSGTWRKLTENVNQLAGTLTTQLRAIAEVSTAVTQGDLSQQITVEAEGEVAELKDNLNQMIDNLRETTRANLEQDWLKTNLARFTGHMQGGRDLLDVTRLIVSELTPLVGASQGSFFLTEIGQDGESLRRIASYGYRTRPGVPDVFGFGEGLVGQAAVARHTVRITDVPGDYVRISSGLGEARPLELVILPVLFEEQVLGVVELASFRPFTTVHMQFLEQLMEIIGVSLNAIIASSRTQALLVESQRLAAELQNKSGELQTQQRELQQSNAELEEKARLLAQQNRAIEIKNLEIEDARRALEDRAEQLALSSRYKSEFLANMSHELRTPLNSLLILAKLLTDNPDGNLNNRQVEFAQTIHSAGTDLLQLINDILDLSKVEAGKMDVHLADVAVAGIVEYVEATFRPLTAEKDLAFSVEVDHDVPRTLFSDQHRLQQVLRNLLSNAVKFTSRGQVTLAIRHAGNERFTTPPLTAAEHVVAFEVTDTGIGIAPEQLRTIFEAFQQADGTISRKFGGTGLGLSISREIARLIGGEIHVESDPGQGSTFTLYLPIRYDGARAPQVEGGAAPRAIEPAPEPPAVDLVHEVVADDEADIVGGDKVLLVALSDPDLSRAAVEIGREHGFKVVATLQADDALVVAHQRRPDAMLVGMDMVAHDGTSLLHGVKRHPATRLIPTVVTHASRAAEDAHEGRLAGALDVVEEPVTRAKIDEALQQLEAFIEAPSKRLLVVTERVDGESAQVAGRCEPLEGLDVDMVGSAEEAARALDGEAYDCVVVDLAMSEGGGFDVLKKIKSRKALRRTPVVATADVKLSAREQTRLQPYVEALTLARPASLDLALDRVGLYLHRADLAKGAGLPVAPERVRSSEQLFVGKRILIVDDDVRNVFALTSALEQHGIDVLYAENGEAGLDTLRREPEIDLVLMDVMMPGMDGYTAMREIRRMPSFRDLPVIALTAKAMPGDRDNSLTAGASDYVTKPVDVDQLLSVFRSWLS
ncbi:MAG: response regulator, partial [Actinomycetes bacterium]